LKNNKQGINFKKEIVLEEKQQEQTQQKSKIALKFRFQIQQKTKNHRIRKHTDFINKTTGDGS